MKPEGQAEFLGVGVEVGAGEGDADSRTSLCEQMRGFVSFPAISPDCLLHRVSPRETLRSLSNPQIPSRPRAEEIPGLSQSWWSAHPHCQANAELSAPCQLDGVKLS